MKRILIVLMIITLALGVTACRSRADTTDGSIGVDTDGGNSGVGSNGGSSSSDDSIEELKSISKELALQMVEGEFKETYQNFSALVKLQMSEKALKEAWDKTIDGMGEYLEIYDISLENTEKYQIVIVILRFENNGLKISFTYNNKNKLEGLWLNYAPIKEDAITTETFEEIEVNFGESEYPISGVLTLPKDVKLPPVVVLVPGSGSHDLNETVGANKPFRDIAHGLAEQGIASIRYNEKLFLYPELADNDLTIEMDSLDDAAGAIAYAASSEQVNADQIYVLGHSLGAMMAPKIATDSKEVAGLILLAGSPRRLEDIIYDQVVDAVANTEGITEEQAEEAIASTITGVDAVKGLKEAGHQLLLGIPATYWYSLNQINIGELAKELTIPMFIAQGSADFQVYKEKDYTLWQELLGDQKTVTFKLYGNLNHLFMTTNGKTDVTEYNTKGTVDQTVIDDMVLWIKGSIK